MHKKRLNNIITVIADYSQYSQFTISYTYAIEFLLRTYADILTIFFFTKKPVVGIKIRT